MLLLLLLLNADGHVTAPAVTCEGTFARQAHVCAGRLKTRTGRGGGSRDWKMHEL